MLYKYPIASHVSIDFCLTISRSLINSHLGNSEDCLVAIHKESAKCPLHVTVGFGEICLNWNRYVLVYIWNETEYFIPDTVQNSVFTSVSGGGGQNGKKPRLRGFPGDDGVCKNSSSKLDEQLNRPKKIRVGKPEKQRLWWQLMGKEGRRDEPTHISLVYLLHNSGTLF